MTTISDRFRKWYAYEQNCNAQSLEMLASIPDEARSHTEFQKAIDKMSHLVAARRRWLYRLGHFAESPSLFPKNVALADLPRLVAETESAWVEYLSHLTDADLTRMFEWDTPDGKKLRWDVESVLTQVFGHAWYHRGQIAQYVARLGGKAVDTDYYFWCESKPLEVDASTEA